jgi:ABC-type transporter Mla subunit MlaD
LFAKVSGIGRINAAVEQFARIDQELHKGVTEVEEEIDNASRTIEALTARKGTLEASRDHAIRVANRLRELVA